MNRHLSLGQIAKFFSVALHQLIWNMISLEIITELFPSHHVTYWLHCHQVLPPLKSSTFQKICHEEHTINGSNMSVSSLRSRERSQSAASRGSEEHRKTGGLRRMKS